MSHVHAVVWLDHREARVFDFTADDVRKVEVRRHGGHRQVHHRAGSVSGAHSADDQKFFADVVAACGDAREVLLVGPGQAKGGFRHYVDQHHREFAQRIVGVESLDHPSDGELLAFARKHFVKIDRMLGTPGA